MFEIKPFYNRLLPDRESLKIETLLYSIEKSYYAVVLYWGKR